MPNAANTGAVVGVLREWENLPDVQGIDRSTEMAMLALQGPRARDVAAAAGLPFPDRFDVVSLDDRQGAVAGTGYTGEEGCEFLVPDAEAVDLWDRLLRAGSPLGLVPCALGARDTLRLEMGYPLHGHEMDDSTSPFEAGLGWVVDLHKEEFRGRAAVAGGLAAVPRRSVGIVVSDKGIPRQGCAVMVGDDALGAVTSGNFSPSLEKGIALARVDAAAHLQEGTPVLVDIRGTHARGVVVKPPFVKKR